MESKFVSSEVGSNSKLNGSYFPKVFGYSDYDDDGEDESGAPHIFNEIYYSLENSSNSFHLENGNEPVAVVSTIGVATTTTTSNFQNSLFEDEQQLLENEVSSSNHFFEIPVSMIVILFLLYGAICITALVGNLLVMGLSMCSGKMRTVTNLFIANLALADIIIGLFTIPFQFQAALLQRWDLPHFLCSLCPFVQVLSVNVSVFTLSAIAVDRYRAVMYPLKAQSSKRKASWAILSIWIVGFLLALPTEFDYQVTYISSDNGESKPFCKNNVWLSPQSRMYYNQSIVVLQYFLPLCIITGAYIQMGSKLWKNQSPGNKEESRDALLVRNKKKVVKMLSLVVLLFALCWFPLQTYNFIQYIFPDVNSFYYINVLWFTFHLLAMSNSCCNPFVYAIYNEKFRNEFRSKFPCFEQYCWRSTRSDQGFGEKNDEEDLSQQGSLRAKSVSSSQNGNGSKKFLKGLAESKVDMNGCVIPLSGNMSLELDGFSNHESNDKDVSIHKSTNTTQKQVEQNKVKNNIKENGSHNLPFSTIVFKKCPRSIVGEEFV